MKIPNLEKMPLDELWALHQTIQSALIEKLTNEKHALEQRLVPTIAGM